MLPAPMCIRRAVQALVLAPLLATSAGAQGEGVMQLTQICLAPAVVEAAPSGVDPIAPVRDAFTEILSGPTLAVEPLTARVESQVRAEAKLHGCRLLLLPAVRHERRSSGGGLLGKVAAGAVQQGAWAATGAGGSAAGRVLAGAATEAASSTVSAYANNSQQRDELTLSYRLESASGLVLLKKSEKRKARSDGEDLLTPLVQRAAEAVAAAAEEEN